MTKSRESPMAGASRRRSLAHSEWNVDTHRRLQSEPRSASTRVRISSAALLVNVTASTSLVCAWPSPMRYAMRLAITRVLPDPAPARINRGPLVCRTAWRCSGFRVSKNCIGKPPRAPRVSLFYRDALREIARLVHIAAAVDGDVVREQLQRQHHEDGREQRRSDGQLEHDVAREIERGCQLAVSARGERNHRTAAGLDLLHVADHLLEHMVPRRERDDRQV